MEPSVFSQLLETLGKVDWAISLLAAIPLAIASNLLTPRVQKWLSSRSETKKQKRYGVLEKELTKIKDFVETPEKLNYETYISIISILMQLSIGSIMIAFPFIDIFTAPVATLFFLNAILLANKHIVVLKRCRDYEKYLKEIQEELKQLGVSE